MLDKNAVKHVETFQTLDQDKQNFKTYFQEVTDFILPYKENVNRQNSPGVRRGVTRYDSTAVKAADDLASMMSGTLFPRGQQWLYLTLNDEELADNKEVKDWLEDCRKRQLDAMNQSNFYSQADEMVLDLVGYGTGNIFTRPKNQSMLAPFGGLVYRAWAVGEYVFIENEQGLVDGVYRCFQLSAVNAYRLFKDLPGWKGSLGESADKAYKSDTEADRHKKFKYLQCITPRSFYNPDNSDMPKDMPFASYYIAVDDKQTISEGGYAEFPASVVRWRMAASDKGWGRGPGLTALPDARTLNEFKRLMHMAGVKDLNPPLLVENKGVIGNIKTYANGVTYKRRGAEIDYLTSGQRLDLANFDYELTRQQIRSYFHADEINLPPVQGTPMTATEIQIRWELMQRLLGPTLGRIETELLNPIVFRTFNIMLRQGAFAPPPAVLQEATQGPNGVRLEVEYVGPLARAQKMADVQAIERTYTQAASIAEAKQDTAIFDLLDDDEALRHSSELLGAPSKIIRDKKAVEEIRKQRQEAVEQTNQMMQAEAGLDIMGKAADVQNAAQTTQ